MSAAIDDPTIDDSSSPVLRSGKVDEVGNQQPSENDENIAGPVRYEGLNTDLANRWLIWQCRMIADVITGCVYSPAGKPLALQPVAGIGGERLAQAALEAQQTDKPVVSTEVNFGASNGRLGDIIATPIKEGDTTLAIVALLMAPRPQSRQNVVLQLLQWGGFWLESLSQLSDGIQQEASTFTQSILSAVLQHSNSKKACMEIASQLAIRLSCDRVTVGMRRGVVVRTECISHLATFDPRTQLIRRLEAAMEESLDQEIIITLPATQDVESGIDQANRDLAAHHNCAVLTAPLTGQKRAYGAIVLERDTRKPFDDDTIEWVESVLSALAPVLELKRFEERPLTLKTRDAAREGLHDLFGPKNLKLKLTALAVGAVLFLSSIIDGNYQVSAPASIEGAISQVIASPISGFIKSSSVRAGDMVNEGDLLATLDDRALQLELKKWQGEENKIKKAYQEALAKRARTELSILRAKADQIDAELALVQERISRTTLRAPYAGYIASGDLTQSLGAPVEVGDVLFEVAPLEEYRAVIEVNERDMANITENQTGEVVIAALPGKPILFNIEQIVPVAISGDGNSYFRVEASFDNQSSQLRPGMEGIARVGIGERKILWIWTHKLIDRISLWLWSMGW